MEQQKDNMNGLGSNPNVADMVADFEREMEATSEEDGASLLNEFLTEQEVTGMVHENDIGSKVESMFKAEDTAEKYNGVLPINPEVEKVDANVTVKTDDNLGFPEPLDKGINIPVDGNMKESKDNASNMMQNNSASSIKGQLKEELGVDTEGNTTPKELSVAYHQEQNTEEEVKVEAHDDFDFEIPKSDEVEVANEFPPLITEELSDGTDLKVNVGEKREEKKSLRPDQIDMQNIHSIGEYMDIVDVNPDEIEVEDDIDNFSELDSFQFILGGVPTSKTQVVAIQSGYKAYMEGLNYSEMVAVTDSTLDLYASRLLLAQTIHKKINTTSIGKMDFRTWALATSFFDLESFLYGIYLESFPGDTKFDITCGHCKKKIVANVNNDSLVASKNSKTDVRMQEILYGDNKATVENNALKKTVTKLLPKSKVKMVFKIPSIAKHLNLISGLRPENEKKLSKILLLMLYIDKVYMMDIKATMKTKKPKYIQITDKDKIARIIGSLSSVDIKAMSSGIEELVDTYDLDYKIRSFACPNCKKQVGDIPVDVEQLLFIQILQLVE